jgi:hypothetical protein
MMERKFNVVKNAQTENFPDGTKRIKKKRGEDGK